MKRNFVYLIAVCLCLVVALVTFQDSALAADGLALGQSIRVGEALTSSDGRYTLTLQRDGNLVLYRVSPRAPLWDSETDGDVATRATLQGDGNFVVYGPDGPLWASGTDGERITRAVLQSDGNFVLYRSDRSAAWATGTNEPPPEPPGRSEEYCCKVYRRDGSLRSSQTVWGRSQEDAERECVFFRERPPASPRAEVQKGACPD